MKIRSFVDHTVVSAFGVWFVATLLSQHPDPSLDRVRRLDDQFGNSLIPNWRFFAPTPAVEDVHILYRFADESRTSHTPWREADTISPRKWHQMFWFPRRRFEKAVFDMHQTLVTGGADSQSNRDHENAVHKAKQATETMLNNYVRVHCNPAKEYPWQQIMLVRFAGNAPDAKPIYDMIFNYAPTGTSSYLGVEN